MGTHFPDLVISEILYYIPKKNRLALRLLSSDWDFCVTTKFQQRSGRIHLWRENDFHDFVNTFKIAKHGVPFSRYIIPPSDGSAEEFHAFVALVGPHVIELTANIFSSDVGITWAKEDWQRQKKPEASKSTTNSGIAHFFRRLDRLLQNVPNLIYLGIMYLGEQIEHGPPVEMSSVPQLRNLKIFAREPADRYSSWCSTLIRHAPHLQNARVINEDSFNLGPHENFDLLEPLLVNGYPLNNNNYINISNLKDVKKLRKNIIKETQYRMFMKIMYTPSMSGKGKMLYLPPNSFRTVTDLYFEELALNNSRLQIQPKQFPNLRRLFLNITAFDNKQEYLFQNSVLPTVEKLTVAIRWGPYKGWNLGRIFPNLRHLHIYVRSGLYQFDLRELLEFFSGSNSLVSLKLEDTYIKSGYTEPFVTMWEEMFGATTQHDCVITPAVVDGDFAPLQNRCSKLDCRGGKGLIFSGIKQVKFAEMKLQTFLPILITGIRSGTFPALERLVLSGYTGSDYSPLKYPNVDDCKSVLSQLVGHITLEINT